MPRALLPTHPKGPLVCAAVLLQQSCVYGVDPIPEYYTVHVLAPRMEDCIQTVCPYADLLPKSAALDGFLFSYLLHQVHQPRFIPNPFRHDSRIHHIISPMAIHRWINYFIQRQNMVTETRCQLLSQQPSTMFRLTHRPPQKYCVLCYTRSGSTRAEAETLEPLSDTDRPPNQHGRKPRFRTACR